MDVSVRVRVSRGRGAGAVVRLGLAAALVALWLPGAARAEAGPSPAPAPPPRYRAAEGARQVEGRPSTADAPLLETGVVYEDTVAPGERVYRLGLDGASTVYVSAVLRPPAGSRVGYSDGVEVEVMTNAGRACPYNPGRASFGNDPVPLAAAGQRRLEEDSECQAPGTYYAKVTRSAAKDSDQAAWPVELLVLREPAPAAGGAPVSPPPVLPSPPRPCRARTRSRGPEGPASTTRGPWAPGCGATT